MCDGHLICSGSWLNVTAGIDAPQSIDMFWNESAYIICLWRAQSIYSYLVLDCARIIYAIWAPNVKRQCGLFDKWFEYALICWLVFGARLWRLRRYSTTQPWRVMVSAVYCVCDWETASLRCVVADCAILIINIASIWVSRTSQAVTFVVGVDTICVFLCSMWASASY